MAYPFGVLVLEEVDELHGATGVLLPCLNGLYCLGKILVIVHHREAWGRPLSLPHQVEDEAQAVATGHFADRVLTIAVEGCQATPIVGSRASATRGSKSAHVPTCV